jgi:hypothetical protein
MNRFETLKTEHVGKRFVRLFDRTWMVCDFIGEIAQSDVGKRVYLSKDLVLQVENDEQRDRRNAAEPAVSTSSPLRDASETLGFMLNPSYQLAPSKRNAIMVARQALDILASLEESLNLHEPVKLEKLASGWIATRDYRTHQGVSLPDALGQLCQTLVMECSE